ncbi:hypothetical protein [Pseudoalteromonas lipolytica]|uniref:hypothetical protein n=1 Tax=Pseudoalteromonas lipolytica TaxID=570156 RepID=UPI003A97BA8A
MYNLLVKGGGWSDSRDDMDTSRIFEYTENYVSQSFNLGTDIDLEKLTKFPCIFMQETWHDGSQQNARVGSIISAVKTGNTVKLEYAFDNSIPPMTNEQIKEVQGEFGIADFEFSRTHWAVKDIDLYKVLLRYLKPRRQLPTVFSISEVERIEPTLVSVMMPFDMAFTGVYEKLKEITSALDLHCRRADDIWENPAIIQDVVSLIDHSRIVICDCSGRNPNVFYEAGIAHTLGREVILITQSEYDIPFDLRHLRYVKYLNNSEGLVALGNSVTSRLETIINT